MKKSNEKNRLWQNLKFFLSFACMLLFSNILKGGICKQEKERVHIMNELRMAKQLVTRSLDVLVAIGELQDSIRHSQHANFPVTKESSDEDAFLKTKRYTGQVLSDSIDVLIRA
jgi:hypothetical protein